MAHEPSQIQLLWPSNEPPLEEEIRLSLQATSTRVESGGRPPPGPRDALWTMLWRTVDDEATYVVWASPSDFPVIDDPCCNPRCRMLEMCPPREVRWVVGVHTVLDPQRPRESFQDQVRFALDLAPEPLRWFDRNAQRLRDFEDLQRIAGAAAPPGARDLCLMHAVFPESGEGSSWLHTHGLQRLGFPDVELLRVPDELIHAGGDLLRHFVDAWLGLRLPPPLRGFELVSGRAVAWIPLSLALNTLEPGEPGSRRERRHGGSHRGKRIVLIDGTRATKGRWRVPLEALRQIPDGGVVSLSFAEIRRKTAIAQATWGAFGMLFVDHQQDEGWEFGVQLGLGTKEGDMEHLWFDVLELAPGKVRGRLESEPVVIGDMRRGDVSWRNLASMSSWIIRSPDGTLTPDDVKTAP